MKMNDDLLAPGRVAVITGAALGIGAAAARHFSALGIRLCLLDRNEDALQDLAGDLGRGADVRTTVGDVTSADDLNALCASAYDGFGEVAVLMNNAGVIAGAGPWTDPSAWRRQLEVNLLSIVTAQSIFVPRMLAQVGRAAVVNLGSKEGITTPPGNAAYSVAKAGVKVLTEQLAHELRAAAGEKVTAHLLVPGYTWTPMNAAQKPAGTTMPDEAWTAEELLAHFEGRFRRGDFYILCPDNAVTPELDAARILWGARDITENRPALSRWHPDWKGRFDAFAAKETVA
ncbi:UNVERIFIED_ORG: NAD(P)-dependent dehydrogenase (short-subunit alcohol dehydrogenase family) [Methylobacterium sp. SuP10 SLI 274]|nr:NAD(P)-dependent dehydrogenase (short-subunit alcohol dehydrogenase family) [Methylorubrum extorquens]MDF9863190.1 NAD(P)-dependent dehydrogenase (short-subunit alcohol dehydrogenase family) [Methylorubrum pseudosasae]MDH6636801.1 NAD(P)-dependent dehydrogenase (short-subunit alcohol dehydrogenase family) [Methylobacterium sp. SuP10 SLI 274]MDH6665978.1 NAD(P)-dependent dehydrogenase (short-subunit alcohol dehydrogenase family) [Methylorubrum zatmanii]